MQPLHEGEQWRLFGVTASIGFVDRAVDPAQEYQRERERGEKKGGKEEKKQERNSKTNAREIRRVHCVCVYGVPRAGRAAHLSFSYQIKVARRLCDSRSARESDRIKGRRNTEEGRKGEEEEEEKEED